MLLLLPFILIVLIIFGIDMYYYGDENKVDLSNKQKIVKEVNQSDVKKDYLNTYLKK